MHEPVIWSTLHPPDKCLLEVSLTISFYASFCNALPCYVNPHLEQLILKTSPIAISWYFSCEEVLISVRKQAAFRRSSVALRNYLIPRDGVIWKRAWYILPYAITGIFSDFPHCCVCVY